MAGIGIDPIVRSCVVLPRITLITPSFQQAGFLEDSLRSVADQDYPDLEHIVVDGGSDDGSRGIIEERSGQLAWWCSEADGGQSAAINKGLKRATGQIFGWLNSDDLLLPGSLHTVAEHFSDDPDLVILTAPRVRRHQDGKEDLLQADTLDNVDPAFIDPRVNQSSTFYRMDAVQALGGLEEKLHYVMDLELWWQLMFRYGLKTVKVLDKPLSIFRLHERSKTVRYQAGFVDETAGLLYGLCLGCGETALAEVLRTGHSWPEGLRPIPVPVSDEHLVRRMVIHFLLKWNRVIFHRRQFDMMKRLASVRLMRTASLDDDQRAAWIAIEAQLGRGGWLAFRARRKWDHWKR